MTKKVKILIFFSLILLALILYLVLTSGSVKKADISNQQVKNQAAPLLEEDYKAQVKETFIVYENLSKDNSLTAEKTGELKNKLLALKGLPAKFKALHINFVLALTMMEDYLNSKNEQGKVAGQRLVNQLKADYSWLNN
ncbi:MAG: hypothetical protein Q7K35_02610 [bacterium]|nr:hypothetical protein [bacterium]